MDPFSIAGGTAGLAVVCVNVSSLLYTFAGDALKVDKNVTYLCEEMVGLSRVLSALSKSWEENHMIAIAATDINSSLWTSFTTSLQDCKTTVNQLDQKLQEIQKCGVLGRGFLRRTVKQTKLNLKMKDILMFRQRIQLYTSAVQSALQMINLCLLIHTKTSQETVLQSLAGLEIQVARVEKALQPRDKVHASADQVQQGDENDFDNLRLHIRAAESFHSSASTIVHGEYMSAALRGNIPGELPSEAQHDVVKKWIRCSVKDREYCNKGRWPSAMSTHPPRKTAAADLWNNIDEDLDIEGELTSKFEELAVKIKQKDYEKAETFLRKAIERCVEDEQSPKDISTTKTILAFAYCFQGKWAEAESIIVPIAMEKGEVGMTAFHGMHTLALFHFQQSQLDTAHKYCTKAIWGKRKIFGGESVSSWESIALLARICDAKGQSVEAESCRNLLPTEYPDGLQLQPLDYLSRATSDLRALSVESTPLSKSSAFGLPRTREAFWRQQTALQEKCTRTTSISRNMLGTPDLTPLEAIIFHSGQYFEWYFSSPTWLHFDLQEAGRTEDCYGLSATGWPLYEIDYGSHLALQRGDAYSFTRLGNALNNVQHLLEMQHPGLLSFVLNMTISFQTGVHESLVHQVVCFVSEMATIVLGSHHPISIIMRYLVLASRDRGSVAEFAVRRMIDVFQSRIGSNKLPTMYLRAGCNQIQVQGQHDSDFTVYLLETLKSIEDVYGKSHQRTCAALLELADNYLQRGRYKVAQKTIFDLMVRASDQRYTVRLWFWLFCLRRLARISEYTQQWRNEKQCLRQMIALAKQVADAKDDLSLRFLAELKNTVEHPRIFGPGAFTRNVLSHEAGQLRFKAQAEHTSGWLPIRITNTGLRGDLFFEL